MFPIFTRPAGLGVSIGGGGGFSTTVASPRGATGLTLITSAAADDANVNIGDIGFAFPLYDGTYQANIFIGSNSYLTFGFGSNNYSGLSRTNPGRGLLVQSADRSYRRIFAGSDGTGRYRVRWEGANFSSSGGGATTFWEVTLFSDGVLMLTTSASTGFSGGVNSLTNGAATGTIFTDYTYSASSSFVFRPNGIGSYTVDVGSYSIGAAPTPYQLETTAWIDGVSGLSGVTTAAANAAVNAFFVTVKTTTYWNSLKVIHLFAGTDTIASAMAPLKHPTGANAYNNGFTGTAYTGSGVNAGIQGDGTNYIHHNYNPHGANPNSGAIGTYSKTAGALAVYDAGYVVSVSAAFAISLQWSDGTARADSFDSTTGRISTASPGEIGFGVLSRSSLSDARYYFSGTQYGINTVAVAAMTNTLTFFSSFGIPTAGYTPSTRKLAFSFAGDALTPAEVASFTSAVNTLIGAL